MDYLLHIAILALIFVILAWSLDLVAGHTGLLSVVQAGFYGVGAYASVLFTLKLGAGFVIGTVCGMAICAVVSMVVALPSIRLRGDFFVIATFGCQMILLSLFNNWMGLTRGPLGIPGIPQPVILGWRVDSHWGFLVLATIFAGFACLDRLGLRRDERAQSGVAAMVSGCGHGARERWSRRSCTALTERIRCEACRTCKQGAHGNNYFPKRDVRWPARIQRRRRSSDPLFKKACFTMRVVAASHNAVTCISLRSGSRLHPHGLAGTFRG